MGCTSCGGTVYAPGGNGAPKLLYDVVVDGRTVDTVDTLQAAVNQVAEHKAAGKQAKATATRG
jgi:hypothetical protein